MVLSGGRVLRDGWGAWGSPAVPRKHPDVSVLGMALAGWSLVIRSEGRQNVLCAYLGGALLIGLAGNAIAGA